MASQVLLSRPSMNLTCGKAEPELSKTASTYQGAILLMSRAK